MYTAAADRYERIPYARCGRSGLQLPRISLGLWQNFGGADSFDNARDMILKSFDHGVTHFDLANNYGPPPGSAEENFGRIVATDLAAYRDELIISTKAGYLMWPGPYGEWGSRKYLLSSLDQSLMRLGLDYVDIFYSHRFDPKTPLEETMGALASAVHSGKALYVGISSYGPQKTREAAAILRDLKTPFVIHQPSYSMLNRWVEDGLLEVLGQEGLGCIAFSPLAQGLLTAKYLTGIPESSRGPRRFIPEKHPDRSQPCKRARTQRHSREARTESRANGDRLGIGQAGDHKRTDRRQPLGADRGMLGRAEESWIQCTRARIHRSLRTGWRAQYLGRIEPACLRSVEW